ncbi:MAG: hypothetical protein IJ593_07980 [Lachnospiraceae bacterium]|nr:hypothetical protein [Lachnospiraceae bacterium]
MSIIVYEMIKKLNKDEEEQVIDYIQYILSKSNKNSLISGYINFLKMREEAKLNGVAGMTLDEINEKLANIEQKENKKPAK